MDLSLVPNAKTTSAFEIISIAALEPLYPKGPLLEDVCQGNYHYVDTHKQLVHLIFQLI